MPSVAELIQALKSNRRQDCCRAADELALKRIREAEAAEEPSDPANKF